MSDVKIFTDIVEPEALNQIYTLVKQPAFADCKVRIMPDVHAGAGCVIGFTADLGDKVIPNIVGVDIGCGMLTVNLGQIDLDLKQFDDVIRKYVPSGFEVHSTSSNISNKIITDLKEMYCYQELKNTGRIENSLGTLGGGNHFVEVDIDDDNNKYLIIHTGSRNLGKQVAEYYQSLAIELMQGRDDRIKMKKDIINKYKLSGRQKEIQTALLEIDKKFQNYKLNIPKDLCYLEGKYRNQYLHDMRICQRFAVENRKMIATILLSKYFKTKNIIIHEITDISKFTHPMNGLKFTSFETIHNYISSVDNVVRKGAISAYKDELVLIPINMRDGCILGKGKGNADYNNSAPHGAGRLMSRSKAKENISLEEFEQSMKGIYTTSVNQSTIDESPMAYKPIESIIDNIDDTVEIIKILKPIYNFKACD